jgi:hypothetical protein
MKAIIVDKAINDIKEIQNDTRLSNALRRAGINTIKDLIFKDTEEIKQIRNFGSALQNKLQSILDKYGIVRIDQNNFENELIMYIKDEFPKNILEILDQDIKDSDLNDNLKQILTKKGFTIILDLTTEKANKILSPKQYDEIKSYLEKKGLINYKDRLYEYFIKAYNNKNKLNAKNKSDNIWAQINEENKNLKNQIKDNKPKQDEYEKLLEENNDLLDQYKTLKESIKLKEKLLREFQSNQQKIEELQKRNQELNQELLTILAKEGIIHGTK